MHPWLVFLKESGKKRLSDIEYLSIKEFGGKRVDADAETAITNTSTETDIVTVTASSGKDMYLAGAKMKSTGTVVTTTNVTYRLFANGVELEKVTFTGEGPNSEQSFNFLTKGVKVAATQIIKLTGQNSDATATTVTYFGKLILFEETTGESPAV